MSEPLNPVQIESKLRALVNAITVAQSDLREARMNEADASIELMRAKITATYSEDCPQPDRKTGVTVGDRESWIDRETEDKVAQSIHATTLREIAQDALRSRIAESQAVQSLNASVRQAFAMAGHE